MQELTMKVKGLYTHPSDLSAVPKGALSVADDVVIDQEEIATPRRGFDRLANGFSSSSYRANKLFFYQDKILAHYTTNYLAYYDSGWTNITTDLDPLDSTTPVRSAEANQNLYLTSDEGIKKLDAYNASIRDAGAPKALGITSTVNNPANTSGWMGASDIVAYRALWGYKDANNNLVIGAVSQREVATSSGANSDVTLRVEIPSTITTEFFLQVYRSAAVTSGTPSDELGLVYETNPTSSDITNGYIEFDDITPDELRGATLYTSATQEGLANNNEQPPLAKDLAVYKGSMFYANTTSKHRTFITLLSASGTNGLAADDTIEIDGVVYTAKASETAASAEFQRFTAGSAAQNIEDTALSLVRVINQYASSTVYAFYLSGIDDLPGKILLEERTIGGGGFATVVDNSTCWSPTADATDTFTADDSTDTYTASAHGLSDGTPVTVSASTSLPTGLSANTTYYVITSTTNTFQLSATYGGSAIDISSTGTGTLTVHVGESSSNDRYKNGLFFSKTDEPEAVPLVNFFTVGSADEEIQRIIPLRDSLFIFKEDGIYRLSGEDPASFRVDLFDSTTRLIAPETIAVLNNQIFALTDQGVTATTEAGVQVKSRPIERTLTNILGQNSSVYKNNSFGIAYETDRKYIMFVPSAAGDTTPTQAFVYNTFTNTWTRWVLSKTCGGVNPADDKLYLGDADSEYLNDERKSYDYTDFADYKSTVTISASSDTTVTLSSGIDIVAVGDVIYEDSSTFARIESIDEDNNQVTINYAAGFSNGSHTLYGSIASKVSWVPFTGKNPGSLKHYRESTLLFKEDFAGNAYLVFTSDVSQGEEQETLSGTDTGAWGQFPWGQALWGGSSNRRPIRVYVPRNKQRCTLLTVEFRHSNAFSSYLLNGVSLVANTVSERVAV